MLASHSFVFFFFQQCLWIEGERGESIGRKISLPLWENWHHRGGREERELVLKDIGRGQLR